MSLTFSEVCWIRLDFDLFTLAGPATVTDPADPEGRCTDSMEISVGLPSKTKSVNMIHDKENDFRARTRIDTPGFVAKTLDSIVSPLRESIEINDVILVSTFLSNSVHRVRGRGGGRHGDAHIRLRHLHNQCQQALGDQGPPSGMFL